MLGAVLRLLPPVIREGGKAPPPKRTTADRTHLFRGECARDCSQAVGAGVKHAPTGAVSFRADNVQFVAAFFSSAVEQRPECDDHLGSVGDRGGAVG